MKKLIFILMCFFVLVSIVHAKELISEDLSYYVEISKSGSEPQIIKVKKIYDKETLNVLFNINPNNYSVNNEFLVFEDYSYENWHIPESLIGLFNTIVYYGYVNNPSDINYFITQIIIWKDIFNYKVDIIDEFGHLINDYDDMYRGIHNKISLHNTKSPFFYQNHNYEIWTKKNFKYMPNTIILDNPSVDGLKIVNDGINISVANEKVGNYVLNFSKEYKQESYSYNDGINFYLQSLGGPSNIKYETKYNVYGIKLNIKENLIGVDGRFGDAKLESKYELYLDNDLKLVINNLDDVYIKSNSNYILKDISNNSGINNIDDITFNVLNEEYILQIDKDVISKVITFNIDSDKQYYIYLKSNDELYEIIDYKSDVITLPFGIYYIKDEDNNYYEEICVSDSRDEIITIKSEIIKEPDMNASEDTKKEDFKDNDETLIDNVDNPKTIDNIYIYKFLFLCSSFLLWIFIGVLKLIN